MRDVVEFLRARLDEDEAVARAASPAPWSFPGIDSVAGGMLYDETRTIASVVYEQQKDHDGRIVRHLLVPEADANGSHIARHDPARVLREVEVKRRLVAVHDVGNSRWVGFPRADREEHYCQEDGQGAPCRTLLALASVYADHPDYRREWA